MPSLPKTAKPTYLPAKAKAKPSSDYKFYNSQRWRNHSRRYRTTCEVCEREGLQRDITPKSRHSKFAGSETTTDPSAWGVTDHIVQIQKGGAKWDERNHMGLCGDHHNQKRGLEAHGYAVKTTQGVGGLIPEDREDIINKLMKLDKYEDLWIL
jgi:5-methylcytosine-specific restriction endonuclease McrA